MYGFSPDDFLGSIALRSRILSQWVLSYSALRPANVSGTRTALRLASEGRPKFFNFVSTIGAAGDATETSQVADEYLPLLSGYSLSKVVAERIVTRALHRGLAGCVVRPGMITGQSQTGVSNPTDFVSRYLTGCIRLKASIDFEAPFDTLLLGCPEMILRLLTPHSFTFIVAATL